MKLDIYENAIFQAELVSREVKPDKTPLSLLYISGYAVVTYKDGSNLAITLGEAAVIALENGL